MLPMIVATGWGATPAAAASFTGWTRASGAVGAVAGGWLADVAGRIPSLGSGVTMFNWKSAPWRVGSSRSSGGAVLLGIVTIHTDEGVEGHAFLGSSRRAPIPRRPGARFLKPAIMGANPLDIGAIWQDMWRMNRNVYTARSALSTWPCGTSPARSPICPSIACWAPVATALRAYAALGCDPRPEDYGDEAPLSGLGWTAYKIHPRGVRGGPRDLPAARKDAVGDRLALMLDSMWAYGLRRRGARRSRHPGHGLLTGTRTRWPRTTSTPTPSCGRQAPISPILATEHPPGGMYGYTQWIRQQATDMLRGDVA